jgi:hypothetical protein
MHNKHTVKAATFMHQVKCLVNLSKCQIVCDILIHLNFLQQSTIVTASFKLQFICSITSWQNSYDCSTLYMYLSEIQYGSTPYNDYSNRLWFFKFQTDECQLAKVVWDSECLMPIKEKASFMGISHIRFWKKKSLLMDY